MSAHWRRKRHYGKLALVPITLSGLVLFASVSQADTSATTTDAALPAEITSELEVSFWVDEAPLSLVINQLAHLAGRSAEITGLAGMPVSGRFSASLGSTLAKLSADYPVVFDLDGKTLRATTSDAQSSVSIAMNNTDQNEKFRRELLATASSGNKVEFQDDAVRVSGHPAFVKRQAGYITRALAAVEARATLDTPAHATEPATTDIISIADSGSSEVLVDIQDEAKPATDQASLSKPIRWVTDIPGFHTF